MKRFMWMTVVLSGLMLADHAQADWIDVVPESLEKSTETPEIDRGGAESPTWLNRSLFDFSVVERMNAAAMKARNASFVRPLDADEIFETTGSKTTLSNQLIGSNVDYHLSPWSTADYSPVVEPPMFAFVGCLLAASGLLFWRKRS